MVCKQCWGLGVRHIQLILLMGAISISLILARCSVMAIKLARGEQIDNASYYEDPFKYSVMSWEQSKVQDLENSIYYVYSPAYLLSGILCVKINNKFFLLTLMLVMSLQSYIIPYLAGQSSADIVFLKAMRIIQGSLQGMIESVVYQIASRWTPYTETCRCMVIIAVAPSIGECFVYGLMTFIGKSVGGWTSVFYISGNIGVLWCVACFTFGSDDPKTCFYVSTDEKIYLSQHIHEIDPTSCGKKIPWRHIYKTKNVHLVCVHSMMVTWATVLMTVPAYVQRYIRPSINQESVIIGSTIALFSLPIVQVLAAIICDVLISKEYLLTSHQRKTCNTIALWSAAISVIFVGYSKVNAGVSAYLVCYVILIGFLSLGSALAPIELSPNYSGFLFGLFKSFGYISVPHVLYLVQKIAYPQHSREMWMNIFYTASLCLFIANFFYIMGYDPKVYRTGNSFFHAPRAIRTNTKDTILFLSVAGRRDQVERVLRSCNEINLIK